MMGAATLQFASAMSVRQMSAEAVLDDSIDPFDAARPRFEDPDHILLTGATGFLGAYLLHDFLRQTSATIQCVVRAGTATEALARIRTNLESYLLPVRCMDRVKPILADLTLPRFGLEEYDFDELAETIDAVCHCAAVVKWTYPYSGLRDANVRGTHEILRLAS